MHNSARATAVSPTRPDAAPAFSAAALGWPPRRERNVLSARAGAELTGRRVSAADELSAGVASLALATDRFHPFLETDHGG